MGEIPGFGKYQLLRRLGVGGMAEVFLARVSQGGVFERPIVIKRVLPHLNSNQSFTRMFLDEVRISASLQHANIVQVFDFGQIRDDYYLALEYVQGRSLYQVLTALRDRGQRMPPALVVGIGVELCRALDYAHERKDPDGRPMGIVHRDVSPTNILLSFQGEVKLVDFGIATAADRLFQTTTGGVKGKCSYMAPEQVNGELITQQTDVFALGVVLYEALTMRTLFTADTALDTLAKVRECDVPPLRDQVSDLPRALERTILHTLRPNPRDRPRTCRELESELASIQRTLPSASLKAFLGHLFADEKAAEEADLGRLFGAARAQEAAAYPVRVAGLDGSALERWNGAREGGEPVFVPTDEPAPLASRVHLLLQPADGSTILRVQGQVVDIVRTPDPGMKVRLAPPAILPYGPESSGDSGGAWLTAVGPGRRRAAWVLIGLAALAVALAAAGLVVMIVRARVQDRAAARAAEVIRERIAQHSLVGPPGDSAAERLTAAQARFPDRPEWRELAAALARALKEAGLAALAAGRFEEALPLLERRATVAPPDAEVTAAIRAAQAGAFASRAGMVRVGDFWIDRYEYPNLRDSPPLVRVDWSTAEDLCRRAGKRLCTEQEWERACGGADRLTYPYGLVYQPDQCVSGAKTEGPQPAGSRRGCVTPAGVADLSGNVAEWTSSPFQPGSAQKVVKGGFWEQSAGQVSCRARDYFLPGQGGAGHIGFRCCR